MQHPYTHVINSPHNGRQEFNSDTVDAMLMRNFAWYRREGFSWEWILQTFATSESGHSYLRGSLMYDKQ